MRKMQRMKQLRRTEESLADVQKLIVGFGVQSVAIRNETIIRKISGIVLCSAFGIARRHSATCVPPQFIMIAAIYRHSTIPVLVLIKQQVLIFKIKIRT
jgi:hypothetical protein